MIAKLSTVHGSVVFSSQLATDTSGKGELIEHLISFNQSDGDKSYIQLACFFHDSKCCAVYNYVIDYRSAGNEKPNVTAIIPCTARLSSIDW